MSASHQPSSHRIRRLAVNTGLERTVAALAARCNIGLSDRTVKDALHGDPNNEVTVLGDPDVGVIITAQPRFDGEIAGQPVSKNDGYLRLILVDPQWREGHDSTFALDLVKAAEEHLIENGARRVTAGKGPFYVYPGVPTSNVPAVNLLLRSGYTSKQPSGHGDAVTFNIRVDIRGLKERDKPSALTKADEGHRGQFTDWIRDNYPFWEAQGLRALEQETLALMFGDGGQIQGFHAWDVVQPGWTGPTGVDRSLIGKRAGRPQIIEFFYLMREQGYEELVLPWVSNMKPHFDILHELGLHGTIETNAVMTKDVGTPERRAEMGRP